MNAPGSKAAETSAYAKITPDEGTALMDEGGVTVVDVRTPQEYAEKHIPGALNIPVEASAAKSRPSWPTRTIR